MGLWGNKLRSVSTIQGLGVSFWCPGCKEPHSIPIEGKSPWRLSGTLLKPTIVPSLETTSGHYIPGWEGPDCWCTYNKKNDPSATFSCVKCHLIVTDGIIYYCPDTTHALSGQHVDLPDLPDLKNPEG